METEGEERPDGLKTFVVMAKDESDSSDIIRAKTYNKAKYRYMVEHPYEYEWTSLRVYRTPWLDVFDDPYDPDATMAMLRHGWVVMYERHDDGLFDDSLGDSDDFISSDDLKEYAESHGMDYENVCERYARHIGAVYPDRYR